MILAISKQIVKSSVRINHSHKQKDLRFVTFITSHTISTPVTLTVSIQPQKKFALNMILNTNKFGMMDLFMIV